MPAQVRPRRRPKACQASLRQDRLGSAGVRQAGAAFDQSVADETIDQAGHAALAEEDSLGQLAHPDPPGGGPGDGQQRVVFGERDVVLGAQLLVEAPRDPRVRQQEGTPRGKPGITGAQRSSGRLGDGHPGDATPVAGGRWLSPQRYADQRTPNR